MIVFFRIIHFNIFVVLIMIVAKVYFSNFSELCQSP